LSNVHYYNKNNFIKRSNNVLLHNAFFNAQYSISQVAEMIRHVIDSHTQPIPSVLEIPSKDHPYDASKDSILRHAKVYFCLQLITDYHSI